jgi:hypothetical protein
MREAETMRGAKTHDAALTNDAETMNDATMHDTATTNGARA